MCRVGVRAAIASSQGGCKRLGLRGVAEEDKGILLLSFCSEDVVLF